MNQKPTTKDLEALWGVCVAWIEQNHPRCAESLLQVGRVNEALPDLAESVCDIVGYFEDQLLHNGEQNESKVNNHNV